MNSHSNYNYTIADSLHSRRRFLQLAASSALLPFLPGCGGGDKGSDPPAQTFSPPDGRAVAFLRDVMDRYHKTFDVFTDSDAGGNHFSVWVKIFSSGDDDALPSLNDRFPDDSGKGVDCIECKFLRKTANWGGWIFQNGILPTGATAPQPNWGTEANAGYNMTGATTLTFMARGAVGGEKVEFFALGVGRDAETGQPLPNAPYPDSSAKATTGVLTLTNQWQKFTIDLRGKDLSYVLGGFGWVASADNNASDITFYLDSITYDLPRLNEPRFLLSYRTLRASGDFDRTQRSSAYLYDTCIGIFAFLASGDIGRAELLAEAILFAQMHDRFHTDNRIRNAYAAGDIRIPPGWSANGRTGTVRLPGWYEPSQQKFVEDFYAAGTATGNVAWAMLALLAVHRVKPNNRYLNACLNFWNWVETNCRDSNPDRVGYTGGIEGFEDAPYPRTYKSTEHNIDLAACAKQLKEFTQDPIWDARYEACKRFVFSMWNAEGKHFWTGTIDDGVTPFKDVIPADIQAWFLQAFVEDGAAYASVMDYVERTFRVSGGGYDFNQDRDGAWREGTGQIALSYRIIGDDVKWQNIISYLLSVQDIDTGGIPAASKDNLTTGFNITKTITWFYYNRLHIAPTGWLILAQTGFNPFRPDKNVLQSGLYVSPESKTLGAGQTFFFTATVVGHANTSVVWSIRNGANGGAIDAKTGKYTAPKTPGEYFLDVKSVANPALTRQVKVTVVAGSLAGTVQ